MVTVEHRTCAMLLPLLLGRYHPLCSVSPMSLRGHEAVDLRCPAAAGHDHRWAHGPVTMSLSRGLAYLTTVPMRTRCSRSQAIPKATAATPKSMR